LPNPDKNWPRPAADDKLPGSIETKEQQMRLEYAVDRLSDIGWCPTSDTDFETLPDGRRYPSVASVQHDFARAGLGLSIKHNLMFSCYRATWGPIGEQLDPDTTADQNHGTVVAACEREAAVYALAQLHAARAQHYLAAMSDSVNGSAALTHSSD